LCEASGPASFLLNRDAAYRFVRQLSIPATREQFALRLIGDRFFLNDSAASQLIVSLVDRLAESYQ
jgi:hypothetical protein